ncbi:hypothetical protein [Kitasatospora sp. CB02891]|uniref:hypothetical protein n=1 Tax=Kitasatospora sp. CB02891 TaxID=2020329 RepID=UPI000C2752DA|nr:hypothetical protein [Kitasatospora sp. CB02891]PJN22481.1 hypothetical protein CG736_28685 [Kitasatospora sp. CB02891]
MSASPLRRTETTKEYDVQEQAPEALFVRAAMEQVTDDLAEPPGLTARAMRDGRRRRLRSRLAVGGAAAGAAALAVTGLLAAVPGAGGSPGPVAVQPGGDAPPRVFPTVTFSPTADPLAPSPPPGEDERRRIETYRQATAGALQDLLPPEIGQIRLVADRVDTYLASSSHGGYVVRFSVAPAPDGAKERSCPPNDSVKTGKCQLVRLPDGVDATVRAMPEGDGTMTMAVASFHLGGSDVTVAVNADESARSSAPVTNAQLADFIRAPRVLELVRGADRNPVQEPGISHDEGANR